MTDMFALPTERLVLHDFHERKERTEWHRVVAFDEKLAEVAQEFVRKRFKVYVEGQLSTHRAARSAT